MELSAAEFAWLRPGWLLAWPLLLLAVFAWRRGRGASAAWQQAVDPQLLPHLLERVATRGEALPTALALLVASLAVLALAGPSWRERAQPLWQPEAPLVIALDLSSAMRAADLAPARLVQARAKLARLLEARAGGQVGLLAYAADAYTVAPITADARTVAALLDSLSPDLMPEDGQRVDRAIAHAQSMLRDSGGGSGEVLVLSDRSDAAGAQAAARARADGVRVSVLGVGTLTGAPLSGPQGFLTGADGQPRLARLDPVSLSELARAGGGRYATLAADDRDLVALDVLRAGGVGQAREEATRDPARGRVRSDDGYWLLLALLPMVLLGFRRGWLALLPLTLALGLVVPPTSLHAATPAATGDAGSTAADWWSSLWQRADQRSHAALQAGDAARARALAPDEALQAAAAYREKDYAAAAAAWAALDSADAHYNRGNALAQGGRLREALAAYDAALAREPGMPDALDNRELVRQLLEQQEQQEQQGEQQGEQQQGQQQGEQQQGEQQQGQQQGEQQQGEQQQGEQQQGEQQQGEQQQGEQQQGEQQQGEQPGMQSGPAQGEGQDERERNLQESLPDAAAQRQAEAAQRQAMQQALEQGPEPAGPPAAVRMTPEQRAQAEQQQANQQLLRRVPDDPGALLRRKFLLEHQRRQRQGETP